MINDGSTDNTDEVIDIIIAAHSEKFRYIKTENSGLAATRNKGVSESSGEYLVFLDADDELADEGLRILRDGITRVPEAKMIVAGHIAVHENGEEVYRGVRGMPADKVEKLRGYLLNKTISLSNGSVAMHREIFARYRYNPEFRSSEDIPVFAFVLANYCVSVEDEPVARVYKHSDSLRHNVGFALEVGETLVDEVFDPQRMPASIMGLKKEFSIQRYLSLSRICFLAKDYDHCVGFYCKALKADWRILFKVSYTRKAFKAWTSQALV